MRHYLAQAIAITPPRSRRRLIAIAAIAALLALFDAALVIAVGPIVKALVGRGTPTIFNSAVPMQVIAAGVLAMLVVKNVLQVALAHWKQRELFECQAYLSAEALTAVLEADLRQAAWLDSGKKSSYVIQEPLQAILNVYTNVISITTELSLVLFVTASLLFVHPVETLEMFAVVGVLIGGFQWAVRGWLRISGIRRRDADAHRHELVRAVVDSEVDVRAMNLQGKVRELYSVANDCSSRMVANKAFATEIVKNVVELAVIVGVAMLTLASHAGSLEELVSVVAVFGAAAYRLAPSFNRLMVCTQSVRFGLPSLEVVYNLLRACPRLPLGQQASATTSSIGELRVDIRELRSPKGSVLLRNQSIRLTKGDVLVVCGPSGIGKSTLMKALIDGADGVWIAVDGQVLDGGLARAAIPVGMAGQRALVFPGTLADNVLPNPLSTKGSSDTLGAAAVDVIHALADRHAGSVLDQGVVLSNMETHVTVSTLSGGQAQRIALMRALLSDRQILLFDEPTSALDAASRDRFVEVVRKMKEDKIIAIVSHDPLVESVATQTLRVRADS
jgi:ABC-type multidrug transport system fused ATPase/permease subunit